MISQRLDVRLDQDRHRKLRELAAKQGAPVSEVVRRLIDKAYDDALHDRRMQAALAIGRMEIEDVPDPETLSRQLEEAHEPGGLD